MKLLFVFLLIGLTSFTQKDTIRVNFDNSLSGSLFNNNNKIQIAARISTQNVIECRKLMLSSSTNYQVNYQQTINGNELLHKTNLSYGHVFCSHIFSYSLIRQIKSDNSFGFGYSYKKKFKKISYGISYALIGQQTRYFNDSLTNAFRHSLRLKFRYDGNFLTFNTEVYLQPNVKTIKDQIIYGTIKLVLLPKTKFSLVIQDNVNYYSISPVRTIHTITMGIGHTILYDRQLKKKNENS